MNQAAAVDDRLGQALAGTSRLDADLAFRNAGEGTYDLRQRPPTVPHRRGVRHPGGIDDDRRRVGRHRHDARARSGSASGSTFIYDGTRWVADGVEGGAPRRRDVVGHPDADRRPAGRARNSTTIPTGRPSTTTPARSPATRSGHGAPTAATARRSRGWSRSGRGGRATRARIAVLSLGLPLGTPSDPLDRHEYIRDPAREAAERGWLRDEPWRRNVNRPDEADDTGWTNGNMDLWIDPSEVEEAVYVRTAGAFERWPRANDSSVTDCN